MSDAGLEPFEVLVLRHGAAVLRVCRAVVGTSHAEDAWSETYLSALQAYPRLEPGSNVEAWLVTIAHRKSIDVLRAQSRRLPAGEWAGWAAQPHSTDGIPGSGQSELWSDLARLPLKQRQCVAYHYLADLPYAEVAAIVGGTPEAARRAAADGIAALRRTYLPEPNVAEGATP